MKPAAERYATEPLSEQSDLYPIFFKTSQFTKLGQWGLFLRRSFRKPVITILSS